MTAAEPRATSEKAPRRPGQFWEVFNSWWRAEYVALGNKKPKTHAIVRWYQANAETLWPEGERPSVKETKRHAKGLRPKTEIREYFRRYRAVKGRTDTKKGRASAALARMAGARSSSASALHEARGGAGQRGAGVRGAGTSTDSEGEASYDEAEAASESESDGSASEDDGGEQDASCSQRPGGEAGAAAPMDGPTLSIRTQPSTLFSAGSVIETTTSIVAAAAAAAASLAEQRSRAPHVLHGALLDGSDGAVLAYTHSGRPGVPPPVTTGIPLTFSQSMPGGEQQHPHMPEIKVEDGADARTQVHVSRSGSCAGASTSSNSPHLPGDAVGAQRSATPPLPGRMQRGADDPLGLPPLPPPPCHIEMWKSALPTAASLAPLAPRSSTITTGHVVERAADAGDEDEQPGPLRRMTGAEGSGGIATSIAMLTSTSLTLNSPCTPQQPCRLLTCTQCMGMGAQGAGAGGGFSSIPTSSQHNMPRINGAISAPSVYKIQPFASVPSRFLLGDDDEPEGPGGGGRSGWSSALQSTPMPSAPVPLLHVERSKSISLAPNGAGSSVLQPGLTSSHLHRTSSQSGGDGQWAVGSANGPQTSLSLQRQLSRSQSQLMLENGGEWAGNAAAGSVPPVWGPRNSVGVGGPSRELLDVATSMSMGMGGPAGQGSKQLMGGPAGDLLGAASIGGPQASLHGRGSFRPVLSMQGSVAGLGAGMGSLRGWPAGAGMPSSQSMPAARGAQGAQDLPHTGSLNPAAWHAGPHGCDSVALPELGGGGSVQLMAGAKRRSRQQHCASQPTQCIVTGELLGGGGQQQPSLQLASSKHAEELQQQHPLLLGPGPGPSARQLMRSSSARSDYGDGPDGGWPQQHPPSAFSLHQQAQLQTQQQQQARRFLTLATGRASSVPVPMVKRDPDVLQVGSPRMQMQGHAQGPSLLMELASDNPAWNDPYGPPASSTGMHGGPQQHPGYPPGITPMRPGMPWHGPPPPRPGPGYMRVGPGGPPGPGGRLPYPQQQVVSFRRVSDGPSYGPGAHAYARGPPPGGMGPGMNTPPGGITLLDDPVMYGFEHAPRGWHCGPMGPGQWQQQSGSIVGGGGSQEEERPVPPAPLSHGTPTTSAAGYCTYAADPRGTEVYNRGGGNGNNMPTTSSAPNATFDGEYGDHFTQQQFPSFNAGWHQPSAQFSHHYQGDVVGNE